MPRVIFVNRYFYPDLSATSQLLTDLAFYLARTGIEVMVITGRYRYTESTASMSARETVNGVKVVRIRTTRYGRIRLNGRLIDYLSFYASAFAVLLRLLRSGDVVVAETDPPLMSVVTRVVARLKGARQVNWLQDLFPEVAVVLEPGLLGPLVVAWAKRARDWSLRYAEMNVVLGELMAKHVLALGVARERVALIPNWADDSAITPVAHEANPLRSAWGLAGKFVVGYSGNLGRAHDFRTALEAARLLKHRSDIVFLVIGDGAQAGVVRDFVVKHGLSNVVQKPYQPRERLRFTLAAADIHLVTLIPELEGLIVPSKFYGIAAAHRGIVFVGDADGEIGTLLLKHGCGRSFSVGDSRSVADFVVGLAQDPRTCTELGRNARGALEREWSQASALGHWHNLVTTLMMKDGAVRAVLQK